MQGGGRQAVVAAAHHQRVAADAAQAVGGVVVEAGVALACEDVVGQRRAVAGEEADHAVDEVRLLEGLVLQGPEHALPHHGLDRGPGAGDRSGRQSF